MAYTAPRTWAIGETPTHTQLNQEIRDNELSLRGLNDLALKVFRTSNQSISSTTTKSAVTWQSSAWNIGAMWSSGTNPTRFTAPVAGVYRIAANIPWTNNGSGRRMVGWRPNGGSVVYALQHQESTGVDTVNGSELISLAANDYVEIVVYQDSGISLNVLGGTEQNASASFRLVATGAGEPPLWLPPRTWADGEILSPALLNSHMRDNIINLRNLKGAGCSVYLSSADASVQSGERAPISWDAANWQVGGMWTSGSQLLAPVTGIYQVIINIEFDNQANLDGVLGCGYVLNGSSTHHDVQWQEMNAASNKNTSGTDLIRMQAGDYLEVYGYQDAGESLSLKNGVDRTRANLMLLAAA